MHFTPIFIITGEQGAGKSAFAGQLSSLLKTRQYTVKGIIAKGIWKNDIRTGFELMDPSGGGSFFLAERISLPAGGRPGQFRFDPLALEKGYSIIRQAIALRYDVIILDEIGMLEIKGGAWCRAFELLLKSCPGILIITVRSKHLEKVRARWKIDPVEVFNILSTTPLKAAEAVSGFLRIKFTGGHNKI